MKLGTCLLLSSLATSALALADDKPPGTRPAPTDPKLAQLVGRWEGKTKMTIRGTAFEMASTFHCQRAVVGPPLVCSAIAVAGARRLEEMHLLGYDKASDTYHLFSVNNWGEAYDHAGKWSDPHKVTFVHDGTRDGKPLRESYTHEIRNSTLTITGSISVDGKVFADGVSTLKRVP